jgi:uncharacterized protein (TIGR02217 family)
MTTAFLETPRFPENISYGSTGGPMFKTNIFESRSALEQRSIVWSDARATYNVSHGIRDKTDLDTLLAFFYNVSGRACGFRFKDWADYQLTAENIGTGDGANLIFPITRTYTTGANTYVRRIFKPIDTVEAPLQVFINGVLQTSPADYTVDLTTGIITFDNLNAPGVGLAVTVTGEFDIPARFDTDHYNASHDGFESGSWGSIPVVEILIDE